MSWLDTFFGGIKRIAIAGVLLPTERTLNFVSGATGADNTTLGSSDVTIIPGVGLAQQSVSSGGSITANANSIVFVDTSGGICSVSPPVALTPGVQWGINDGHKTGSFSVSKYVSISNASAIIEDPNNPNTYTTNPIKIEQPGQPIIWMADPTGSFWKLM